MKDIECKEVIIATLRTRGDGVNTPFRKITEVYNKDGTLIALTDPHPTPFCVDDIVEFCNWFLDGPRGAGRPTAKDVHDWYTKRP